MFRNRVTEMLHIEYPIIQGGMLWISCPELAAAVSNEGGLGMLASAVYASSEELRDAIWKTKSLTDKPFGVNISLFPTTGADLNEEFIDVLVEEGVGVAETSGMRSPAEYVGRLKEGNVKIIHKCAGIGYAKTAERVGVDAVTMIGAENGGATGMSDVTTFVAIPAAVNALNIPVIAAGGICDARSFVAALALGAEGVLIGTRFMATHESPAHPKFKEWLVKAKETDTIITERSLKIGHRVLRNQAAEKVLEVEGRGSSSGEFLLEELLPLISGEQARKVMIEGKIEEGLAYCGQVVGRIDKILSVKEVIREMVNGDVEINHYLDKILSQ